VGFEKATIAKVVAGVGGDRVTLILNPPPAPRAAQVVSGKVGFGSSRSRRSSVVPVVAPVLQQLVIDNPPVRRGPKEEAGFRRALDSMHLLYAHAAVTVFVLSDSALGADGRPLPPRAHDYFSSGWTMFEMTASRLTKDMHSLVVASHWPGVVQVGEATRSRWRPFEPPASPEEFYERVRCGTLHFTNQKDDSELVARK
jgi:hypothetical protein